MKILRIIASVDPRDGGPVEGLRQSADALGLRGHETEVVTLDAPGSAHVAAFPYKVHPQGRMIRRYGYTPKLSRWIAANARRFDAAVIHGLWNHASVGGWQGLRLAGLPYVIFTHGMLDPWFRETYRFKHIAKQIFWTLWQGRVLRDAAEVLFTSEQEQLAARGVFHGHSYQETIVAYGTATPPPVSAAQRQAFHGLVPALGARPYLLFLSRLHEKKGCDLLIDAFAGIASAQVGTDLVIAGPDAGGLQACLQRRAAEAGIAERIHWPGMLGGAAKYGAFYGAEAFILPSHQENFGIAVAEAMACGIPVLITDKVNIWREIVAAGSGLVEPDTAEGIALLLRRWFDLTPAARGEMGERARECFRQRFHIDAAAADLERALDRARRTNERA